MNGYMHACVLLLTALGSSHLTAAAVPLTPDSSLCACTCASAPAPAPAAMGSARAPAICPVSGAAKTSSRAPRRQTTTTTTSTSSKTCFPHMHALFNLEVSSISYHKDTSKTASPPSTILASSPKLTPKLKLEHTHSAQPNNSTCAPLSSLARHDSDAPAPSLGTHLRRPSSSIAAGSSASTILSCLPHHIARFGPVHIALYCGGSSFHDRPAAAVTLLHPSWPWTAKLRKDLATRTPWPHCNGS